MWRRIANALNPPRPGQPRPGDEPAAPEPGARPAAQAAPSPDAPKVRRFTCCQHAQCLKSAALAAAIRREAGRLGLKVELAPALTVCPGACPGGPFLGLPELGLFYHGLTTAQARPLLLETSLHGRLLFSHLYLDPTVVHDSRIVSPRQQPTLVAMEADYCLVSLVAYLFIFNAAESCGKCFPCRLGVHVIARLLRQLMEGQASPEDLERLRQTAQALATATYCQFGQRISQPLRLALELAWPVFERHATDGGCHHGERSFGPGKDGRP